MLWYQTTVHNLKSVLKLSLETIGANKGMDGHIHVKSNEGYHIIPRHLEINVDVKCLGEDDRTDG
jgi:hypothetical protein